MKLATIMVCVSLLIGALFASSAGSQDALPEQSPLLTACQSARSLATISGMNMESCRRVAEVVEGNTALVTVRVKISGEGVYFVSIALMKTAWGQQAISVRPG